MGFFVFSLFMLLVLAVGIRFAWDKDCPTAVRLAAYIGVPFLYLAASLALSASSVPTGHIGIVKTFGAISGQRGEGLQWTWPWQSMTYASVQIQGHKFEKMTSFSSETQQVTVTATINVSVLPGGIQSLYREVGDNYFDILVQPRVMQAFKDETVKYGSIYIAPKREDIRAAVRDKLKVELQEHSILVQDLLIDDISFGDKFEAAIEEKQTQSQLALAEKEKISSERSKADQQLEKARGEAGTLLINAEKQAESTKILAQADADSTLIKANKQAEANKTLSDSITPSFLQYLAISKLNPNVNVMMVPNNGLIMDIGSITKK